MKLIKTNRDLTVWIIALIWLIINISAMMIWNYSVTIITNPLCLLVITVYVFYSKHNSKLNNWLNKSFRSCHK